MSSNANTPAGSSTDGASNVAESGGTSAGSTSNQNQTAGAASGADAAGGNATKIWKVRQGLRDVDGDQFTPEKVSIGFYHHGLHSDSDKNKEGVANWMCPDGRANRIRVRKELTKQLGSSNNGRDWYPDVVPSADVKQQLEGYFSLSDSSRMPLLDDGCYVLHFLVEYKDERGVVIKDPWRDDNESSVMRDILFLLENQIPWSVLREMHGYIRDTDKPDFRREMARCIGRPILTDSDRALALLLALEKELADRVRGLLEKRLYTISGGGRRLPVPSSPAPTHLLDLVHHYFKPTAERPPDGEGHPVNIVGCCMARWRWRRAMDVGAGGAAAVSGAVAAADEAAIGVDGAAAASGAVAADVAAIGADRAAAASGAIGANGAAEAAVGASGTPAASGAVAAADEAAASGAVAADVAPVGADSAVAASGAVGAAEAGAGGAVAASGAVAADVAAVGADRAAAAFGAVGAGGATAASGVASGVIVAADEAAVGADRAAAASGSVGADGAAAASPGEEHRVYIGCCNTSVERGMARWRRATEYRRYAFVQLKRRDFKKGVVESVLDVRLEGRTLWIPTLRIDELTYTLLRNLIALEDRMRMRQRPVTAYCLFMSQLACKVEDVELLQRLGILQNFLPTDEDVVKGFGDLCKEVVFEVDDTEMNYLNGTWHKLHKRCRAANTFFGLFRERHCSNSVRAAASIAAVFLFVFQAVQVAFAVASYTKKSHS